MISDHIKSSNSCKGRDKFWIQVINRLVYCLIIQLSAMNHINTLGNVYISCCCDIIWTRITSKSQQSTKPEHRWQISKWLFSMGMFKKRFCRSKVGMPWISASYMYVKDTRSRFLKFDHNSKIYNLQVMRKW